MLMKPDTTDTTVPPAAASCGNCGVEDRRFLHSVRHRGVFRRLCTSCVLRLHAQSFCPICFQVYTPAPSNESSVNCFKCYSSSHSYCVAAGPSTSPPNPYVCPLCTRPSSPIFKLESVKEGSEECKVIDRDAAKKLLAAAKIASTSMNRAVVAAKLEAERRAKEAAFARKRAKEALEHAAYLVMKEKLRKKEAALSFSGVNEIGVGYLGGGGNSLAGANVKGVNNVNVINNSRNGNVDSLVNSLVVAGEKIVNTASDVHELDSSSQVLEALNWVDLKDNEKIGRVTGQITGLEVQLNDGHELMDVDEKAMMGEVAEEDGTLVMEGNDISAIETDEIPHLRRDEEDHIKQGGNQQEVNNGVVLIPSVADRTGFHENSDAGEQHDKLYEPKHPQTKSFNRKCINFPFSISLPNLQNHSLGLCIIAR